MALGFEKSKWTQTTKVNPRSSAPLERRAWVGVFMALQPLTEPEFCSDFIRIAIHEFCRRCQSGGRVSLSWRAGPNLGTFVSQERDPTLVQWWAQIYWYLNPIKEFCFFTRSFWYNLSKMGFPLAVWQFWIPVWGSDGSQILARISFMLYGRFMNVNGRSLSFIFGDVIWMGVNLILDL